MKKPFLISLCLLLLAACSKTAVTGSNVVTAITKQDTITLTDNGVTYLNTGKSTDVGCILSKTENGSTFDLRIVATDSFPFFFQISAVSGSLDGVGAYGIGANFLNNYFYEYFNRNQVPYTVDNVLVNISYEVVDTVIGNYTVWVTNGTDNKIITGAVKFYNAGIQ